MHSGIPNNLSLWNIPLRIAFPFEVKGIQQQFGFRTNPEVLDAS
jgi:hypothetical protein